MDELKVQYSTTQYIVISIGDEQFGIDIRHIDNIVRMQNITRVPKVPAYLKGVINLRGEIIPVMSLRLKMELPLDEVTKQTRIIILKMEQHEAIGIIVDSVKEVVTLGEGQVEKVSYDKDDKVPFVSAVGKLGEELISLLDIGMIVAEKEA